MADATVGVVQGTNPDRLIDNESLTIAAQQVYRQRTQIAGAGAAEITRVINASPTGTEYGPVVRPVPMTPAAANILVGYQTFAATTAATTVITVPAGKTWSGVVSVSAACTVAGASATAGKALGVVSIGGAGATPSGNVFAVDAEQGANVAAGTVGGGNSNFGQIPLTVVAPAGNTVTVQITVTITGTTGRVDVTATGQLY